MSDFTIAAPETRLQNFLERAGLRGFPWITAIVLYTISWGWLFIVRDSLWGDDWFLVVSFDLSNFGFAPWYESLFVLYRLVGSTFSRSLIFLCFFISSILLFGISGKIKFLTFKQRQLLVLLFLLLPFNTARVAFMTYLYSISYFLFFVAWFLIVTFQSRKVYCGCLLLFFLSFAMHSLLVFFFLPLLHLIFVSQLKSLSQLFTWFKKHIFLVALPFVYWLLRAFFWPEKVLYHNVSPARLEKTFNLVIISLSLLACLLVLQKKTTITKTKNLLDIFLIGFLAIIAGTYPYVVLGYFKADLSIFSKYFLTMFGRSDWYSRHQALQPLGVALLIIGMIELLPKFLQIITKQIKLLVLAICVIFNLGFGFEFVADYSKQQEVIAQLKNIGRDNSLNKYQFVDETTLFNARGRAYRDRDWYGLISLAYDTELQYGTELEIKSSCEREPSRRLVLIEGPETHWQALKNWVGNGDMGFEVTVDDSPGACKPEMVTSEKVSGAIPILFYFTGARN